MARDHSTPEFADQAPGRPGPLPSLRARRIGFALLVLGTSAGLLGLMSAVLFPSGVDPLGIAMLLLFAITLAWTTTGFWNAVIGLSLTSLARDPQGFVAPHLRSITGDEKIASATALAICIRNEDTARLSRNLRWMLEGLVATGEAHWFHLYILSDSNQTQAAAAEEMLAAELGERFGAILPVTYRRREQGAGFKAGNIRDFCERWGSLHEFAIVLDADSVMTPRAMLRLVRVMQARPGIGILQTLVTGLPAASAFARIFQFGMRLGMRSYTLGAASWQGDCGPYWGHNAILRLAPFIEHCRLPVLAGEPPLGGHVLSHDQLEAVLMRRAGFEVRVLPDEDGSWEENPPTLLEFIRRDLRWCQGNMQYLRLLGLRDLMPVSRVQLWMAIAMYASAPAWLGFMLLGLIRQGPFRTDLGIVLLGLTLAMSFAPKLATLFDVLARRRLRQAFGGGPRVVASAMIELLFSMLIVPVCALSVTMFVLGLPFGRQVGWTAQQREASGIAFGLAARRLWPHTVAGVVFAAWLWRVAPGALWIGAPFFVGLAASIPIAMLTAHPRIGRALGGAGICLTPEETRQPERAESASLFSPFAAATASEPFAATAATE